MGDSPGLLFFCVCFWLFERREVVVGTYLEGFGKKKNENKTKNAQGAVFMASASSL